MITNNYEEIEKIFIASQKTTASHQKNAIILSQFVSYDDFWEHLKRIIVAIIHEQQYSGYVDKVMAFFSHFCSLLKQKTENDSESEHAEHPLLVNIISFLIMTSQVVNDTVRLRSCQLINKILDNLIGTDISIELCEQLEKNLILRLQDSKSAVRQQAIVTLHWLQDPCNSEDIIISELLYLMNSDRMAKVRQLCVEKIAPRKDVVISFVKRIQDVDVNVRMAVYKRLSGLPGFLKITEKRKILECALYDTSEKVKEFLSTKLLNSWLNYYDDDIIKFMKSIRLDADEQDINETDVLFEELLSNIILKDKSLEVLTNFLPLNEQKVIPIAELDWEIASYWRIYVQYLQKNNFEEEISNVVPDLKVFCSYIKQYCSSMSKEFTTVEFLEEQYKLKQLFYIIKTYDFADPARRHCLNKLVGDVLENVILNTDVTELIVSSLEQSIEDINKRTQFVCELISNILYPINSDECEQKQQEKDYQVSVLTVKLDRIKEEQVECIKQQDFISAEKLKNEIEETSCQLNNLKNQPVTMERNEKRTDLATILKCLDIAAGILISPQVKSLTPSLKSLKENFIYDLLMTENDSVRVKVFRCFGLYCYFDKEIAKTGIHTFSTPIFAYKNGEECDTQLLLICICAVVDLLLLYGPQLMAAQEKEKLSDSNDEAHLEIFAGGTTLTDVIQGLVDLMDDEQFVIQEKAALGLCKLIIHDRVISSSLITRLVLKWANPASDPDISSVNAIIGYTLEKIAAMPQFVDQLEDAVLLTVNTLYAAPRVSPLADINVEDIAKFMLALCKTSAEANRVHSNIALNICSKMVSKPKSKLNLVYSKILLMLDIDYNQITMNELMQACDLIKENIQDRTIIKNITKFTASLQSKEMKNCSVIMEENEKMEE